MANVLTEYRESGALINGRGDGDIDSLADLAASVGLATRQAFVDAQTVEGRGIYDRWYPGAEGSP